MIQMIDKSKVTNRLCAECCNMGSFICMSCTIPKIIKGIPTIEVDLDEYRQEAEEIYRAGGAGGEEAEELRNLLYCLINQLSLLE